MYFEMLYYTGSYDTDGGFTTRQVRVEEEVVEQLLSNTPPAFIKIMLEDGQMALVNTININMLTEIWGIGNPQGEPVNREELL